MNPVCAAFGHRRSQRRAVRVSGCWHSRCVICDAPIKRRGPRDWVTRQAELSTSKLSRSPGRRRLPTVPYSSASGPLAERVRKAASYIGVSVFSASMVAVLSLVGFLHEARAADRPVSARSDAIVAFSGDPDRIRAAGALLAGGYARHLLIVGQDNGDEVSALRLKYPSLADCCIVRNPMSRTTQEDARLAGDWITSTKAHSVILVTSDFHVPRAMVELRRESPKTSIVSSAVRSDTVSVRNVFEEPPGGGRLLFKEFTKFVAASIPGMQSFLGTGFVQATAGGAARIGYRSLVAYVLIAFEAAVVMFGMMKWPVAANVYYKWRWRRSRQRGR